VEEAGFACQGSEKWRRKPVQDGKNTPRCRATLAP
jgi:hypothetical protein